MADGSFVKIAPLMRDPGMMEIKTPEKLAPSANGAMICGVDVGSTTVKYVLASPSGEVISQAYERHNTKQAEKVLQFLSRLEAQHGLDAAARSHLPDRVGSGPDCSRRGSQGHSGSRGGGGQRRAAASRRCVSSAKSVEKI